MAIPPQQLIALTTMMFNAPPGARYLAELQALAETGASITAIAAELSFTPIFNSQFAGLSSDQAKIDLVLANLGITAESPAYAEAAGFFNQAIAAGVNPGVALSEAASFLSTTEQPEFASAAALFQNKVAVGITHSVTLGMAEEGIAELQQVLVDVTEDPASVVAVEAALQAPPQEETVPEPPSSSSPPSSGASLDLSDYTVVDFSTATNVKAETGVKEAFLVVFTLVEGRATAVTEEVSIAGFTAGEDLLIFEDASGTLSRGDEAQFLTQLGVVVAENAFDTQTSVYFDPAGAQPGGVTLQGIVDNTLQNIDWVLG